MPLIDYYQPCHLGAFVRHVRFVFVLLYIQYHSESVIDCVLWGTIFAGSAYMLPCVAIANDRVYSVDGLLYPICLEY